MSEPIRIVRDGAPRTIRAGGSRLMLDLAGAKVTLDPGQDLLVVWVQHLNRWVPMSREESELEREVSPITPAAAMLAGIMVPEGALAMIRENPVAPGCYRWLTYGPDGYELVDTENGMVAARELMRTPCSPKLRDRVLTALPADDPSACAADVDRLGAALSSIEDLA